MADFLGGLMARRMTVLAVIAISQTGGLFTIAVAVAANGEAAPSAGFVPYAALAGLGGVCGLAAFYRALSIGKMGVVAPISSMAVLVPVIVGLATGDRPSGLQYAGACVGVIGIMLASREAEDAAGSDARVAAGAGLALVSALGFGTFFVAMDVAADYDPLWANLANRSTSLSLALIGLALFRPAIGELRRRDVPVLLSLGVLEMAANVSFAFAATEGLLSITAVIASLYPIVTVFLAWLILHERLDAVQKTGVAFALTGVALIASG